MRKPYQVRDATLPNHRISLCVHCGNVAKKEALFKSGGFTIIEKYCDDCMKTENFGSIMTFYARTENPAAVTVGWCYGFT